MSGTSIILAGPRQTYSWLLGVAYGTPEIRAMFEAETSTVPLPNDARLHHKHRYNARFFSWARARYGMGE